MAKRGIGDRAEAMGKMVELAAEATRLATAVAERDEAIARINEAFAERIETGGRMVTGLKAELKAWAQENEAAEADKATRIIRFAGVGEIQLRTGNPEVRLARGVTEPVAIGRLFDAGLGHYVRTVQELDREAILADREDPVMTQVQACGIKAGQSEGALFSIEGVGRV